MDKRNANKSIAEVVPKFRLVDPAQHKHTHICKFMLVRTDDITSNSQVVVN